MSEFLVRAARIEEAPAIADIHNTRRGESLPSYSDHVRARLGRHWGWAIEQAEACINNAGRSPSDYLSLVAVVGNGDDDIVGFMHATVRHSLGKVAVHYNGLFMRKEYEGQGGGRHSKVSGSLGQADVVALSRC